MNKGLMSYLRKKLKDVEEHYPQIGIQEVNHDEDHIHMLVSIPPQMSVGSVVRIIKSNTSRKIKEEFAYLKKVYWGADGIWSEGYFVSTVGATEAVIRQYITNQGFQDSGQAELELG